ncbi:hypothetical protein J43TS9_52250 [Paenibacillus cineris]|nr:hypothetical protein J43TS9_52250 [Paenibacillus cineris]
MEAASLVPLKICQVSDAAYQYKIDREDKPNDDDTIYGRIAGYVPFHRVAGARADAERAAFAA